MGKPENKARKKKYEKAVLRSFPLVADEVMAPGCKTVSSNPGGLIGGATPCDTSGCSNNGS